MNRQAGFLVMIVVLSFALAGCKGGDAQAAQDGESPIATVEPIEGSDVARVTLSEDAAKRLDIQTVPVTISTGGKTRTAIPYAAVLYDPAGDTWTYTEPEPLVFVRAPIQVVRIDGDQAFLSEGPDPGTAVVTVGAAELLGTEYEVGEE